jgi:hypothetical protein
MVLRGFCLGMILSLSIVACRTEQQASPSPEPSASAAPAAPEVARYGAAISGGESVKLSTLLEEPQKYTDKSVIIEAEVRRACSRKGCWMELAESSDTSAPGCRVTFKDYGFFVPLDSAGAHARVQGSVAVETVAASYVKHLEEEGARFARKNADGTADEVRLVATGVELSKK